MDNKNVIVFRADVRRLAEAQRRAASHLALALELRVNTFEKRLAISKRMAKKDETVHEALKWYLDRAYVRPQTVRGVYPPRTRAEANRLLDKLHEDCRRSGDAVRRMFEEQRARVQTLMGDDE